MTEQWLPVYGWEGLYAVSSRGQVRSDTTGALKAQRRHYKTGYCLTGLKSKGRRADPVAVHTLVLEAFDRPRPAGLVCRHLNGIPDDNWRTNLKWGTHEQNAQDTLRHGRNCNATKVVCKRQHLLVAPNLTAVAVARGYRACLACHDAIVAMQRVIGSRRDSADPAEWERLVCVEADLRFAEITGRVAC